MYLRTRVDNVDKLGLERGTANEVAVNVRLVVEGRGVLAVDRASVDDADVVGGILGDLLGNVGTDSGVDLLGIVRSGGKAGADGPDGLVGNHNLVPVLGVKLGNNGVDLRLDNVNGLVGVALLEGLTNAENDRDTARDSKLGLLGNELVVLLDNSAALRVADDNPSGTNVLDLVNRNLTGVGARALDIGVLGGNANGGLAVLQKLDGPVEVREGRGNDDLSLLIELGLLEVADNRLDGLKRAVHLEVATDEELAGLLLESADLPFVDPVAGVLDQSQARTIANDSIHGFFSSNNFSAYHFG